MKIILLIMLLLINNAVYADFSIEGNVPRYLRGLTINFPNNNAVDFAGYVPDLDNGFVPQGIAVNQDIIYLSGYNTNSNISYCSIYGINMRNKKVILKNDIYTCKHGGSLSVIDKDRLLLTDTKKIYIVNNKNIQQIKLLGNIKGSFSSVKDGSLFVGVYAKNKSESFLYKFKLNDVLNAKVLDIKDVVEKYPIPLKAQGADFDSAGNFWLTTNESMNGLIWKLDYNYNVINKFKIVRGIEDIDMSTGIMWIVSESGSKIYQNWFHRFPMFFEVDSSRLK